MSELNRRTFLKSVGGTGVALSVAGCSELTGSGGGGENTIVPGTASGFPPFEFVNESGELVGFDVDLLSAVVEQTDYTLGEWEDLEFGQLITALDNDRIDVIAAAMTINDDRDQAIDFTDPYYDANQAILVRDDGEFSPGSLDDLSGHKVGAQKGTTGENVVKEQLIEADKLKQSNYKAYDNYTLAVTDLENGNVDAVVLDTPVADSFQGERDVTTAFTYETGEKYGFGVREDDDDLREALNEGLATVMEDGTYEDLTKKWFQE